MAKSSQITNRYPILETVDLNVITNVLEEFSGGVAVVWIVSWLLHLCAVVAVDDLSLVGKLTLFFLLSASCFFDVRRNERRPFQISHNFEILVEICQS